ncbi:GDNF family receptor alpha-like isoform X1 [Alosa sapidissima]|uniref:GDNF family receptor alpha-like isoform X1 n=2 Tax=Alosa sapidissima TaxID=34773 RepID=UPI001C09D4F2|nr:GDNF family receptor alpha-like isoform X1 [Alosa sapidissima]
MSRASVIPAVLVMGALAVHISGVKIFSKPKDCSVNLEECIAEHNLCKREGSLLESMCGIEGRPCQLEDPAICNMTIQFMLSGISIRRGCFCQWEEEPCTLLNLLTASCQQHKAEQKTVPKMKRPDSGLSGYVPGMSYSCSGQMNICLEDEACNRWLVPLVKACSSPCNQSQCGQRIQQFYKGMPQTTAEKLVFCTCEPEDQECQVMRANLHGGTCEDTEEDWTCLEMLDSCVESLMCRERFGTLLSKCLGIEPVGPDANSYSEWVNLIDSQQSWSQDRECKMALVASMGTMLQQPCSCDGLPIYELHKCNILHQLLHNKSIFISHLAITGAPDQSSEANEWISAQWRWSDHLMYIFVYSLLVVAILGVVIIVLHKLGRQKAVADQLRYGTPSQKNSGTDANRCQY